MSQRVREPSVAGYFYPSDKNELVDLIERLFRSSRGPGTHVLEDFADKDVIALLLPHAGYIYSGEIAAYGYAAYNSSGLKKRILILGPNHYGLGALASIYPEGMWRTPLGEVVIDPELSREIPSISEYIVHDEMGHVREHSIEVQLPILQYIHGNNSFLLTPISIMLQTESVARDIGYTLRKLNDMYGGEILFIVSTDFTHYESSSKAYEKDMMAIKKILDIDPDGFLEAVYSSDISMCGYGPTAALLYFLEGVEGVEATLLKYGHSGEVTGDVNNVVGYASIAFYKV